MKCRVLTVVALMFFVWTAALGAQTPAGQQEDAALRGQPPKIAIEHVEGELLVKFRPDVPGHEKAALHRRMGTERLSELPALRVERVRGARGQSTEALLRAYSRRPEVEYAEPNGIVHATLSPTDPLYPNLWGMVTIDAPLAWDLQTGSPSIVIADIDSGVDYTHEDLAANMWTNPGEIAGNGIDDDGNGYVDDVRGWDFANDDNDPMDDHGHGTHTSGTIAAVANNGLGVAGVMWEAKIMPLKFLGASGSGTFEDGAEAILYAVQMGAPISSNSWGCSPSPGCYSQVVEDAIAVADQAGMLFVVAAGNDGRDNETITSYPCDSTQANVVCVAATDQSDLLADFSNWGVTEVDLGAPGVGVQSTVPAVGNACCSDPSGYLYLNGTSMATPHVSGTAGLLLSEYGSLPPEQLKDLLLTSVDPVASLVGITVTEGRLNAGSALNTPFTVGLTPRSQSVVYGSSVDYTVSVRSLNGFSAPVTLTFSSPDPDITGSISPSTVTPPPLGTAQATLSVDTTLALARGEHRLAVSGSDGQGEDHQTSAFLVATGPDFEIAVDPASGAAAAGGSTDYDVVVSSLEGWSGSVSLSLVGDPAFSGVFTPTPVSVPAYGSTSSTLTLSVAPGTALGSYSVSVEGTDGVKVRSRTVGIDVTKDIDVAATSVSGDTSLSLGTYGSSQVSVVNYGSELSGVFTTKTFACPTPQPGTECRDLSYFTLSLQGGETWSNSVYLAIPNYMTPGTYYLVAEADVYEDIAETDEGNNYVSGNTIDVLAPDLEPTSMSGPSAADKGASVNLNETVINNGPGQTPTNMWPQFRMGLYLSTDAAITTDDTFLGFRYVDTLTSGASSSGSTAVTIPASLVPGTYYLGTIADYPDNLIEVSEANNSLAGNTIQISPPTTNSDLVMTDVSGPKSVSGTYFVVSNTVQNQGTESTGVELEVVLYLSVDQTIDASDIAIRTRTVGALAPGQSSTADTPVYLNQLDPVPGPGVYYLGAIADDGNWVAESNEGNNAFLGNKIRLR